MRGTRLLLLAGFAAAVTGCPVKPAPKTVVVQPGGAAPVPAADSSAATPPNPGTGSIADPLATPPPGLPPGELEARPKSVSAKAAEPLPEGLDLRSFSGTGLMVDIVVAGLKPGPGHSDPARVSYAIAAQRSETEHELVRSSGTIKPTTFKLKDRLVQLEVTARYKPQRLSTASPSGETPRLHQGWYDVLVKDGQGRPLGRFGITGLGWVTKAKGSEQPQGAIANATEEGNPAGQFFDFIALKDGTPLLRMESEEYGVQTLSVKAADGTLHDITMPHAALRFHEAGTFETTAQQRGLGGYSRDPNR